MITPYQVLRAAEAVTSKPARIITGRSRKFSVAATRDACILIVHENTRMSDGEIARIFNRSRSAVSYAVNRATDRLTLCDQFRAIYESINNHIKPE